MGEQRYSSHRSPQSSSPPYAALLSSLLSCFLTTPIAHRIFVRTEQQEIIQEILHLNAAIPFLAENYQVIDRLGTGNFSGVYKAIDLRYDEQDSKPWKGNHLPESSAYYQYAGPGYRGRGGRGPGIGKDKVIENTRLQCYGSQLC